MNKRLFTYMPDPILLFLIGLLLAYGLVVLYSAGGMVLVERQAVRIALGLIGLYLITQIRPERFEQFTPLIFVGSIILLVAVLLIGVKVKGAQRWLDLGITIQPSELCKITLPMMVAWIFRHASLPPSWKHIFAALIVIGLCTGLIYKQPDLGTSILIATSGLFVIYFAGISWKLIGGATLLGLLSTPVIWHFMHEYQKQRVLMFLNPEADPLNYGWNIIQSKIAIGSGGFWGKGWTQGTQTQLDFLPEHSTDFILSVMSEEFGFFGVLMLFTLYLSIILRCLFIAQQAKNTYNRLLCGALTLIFFVYIIINAGMISGVLPVVGVPLPLVSYGGTSVLTLLASFGIITAVHSHKKLIQQ
ncbi:rod shape-determining protein RodA [Marinicella litoralis]|uniref:Peptidoglycan glycosyltransferase MrdB n=1 Tax=Marinicella litoralis TaxID=644220 RepID=A0A4R6XRT3_9GAMM|nr:rod shape-determining protein RodA [Marinicella litoralis]TDR20724.1 cell elongation-specific peptidoglycan biosynthesis regulator RodA [Marinicella litoralis]